MSETDYVKMFQSEDGTRIDIIFDVVDDKVMAIGEKMNAINEEAYMNGYNWEAFLHYYLAQNAPEVLEGLVADPEADMYAAFYEATQENREKAGKFVEIIRSLIDNEKELYRILQEEGAEIEWD